MTNEQIIADGFNLIYTEAGKCGMDFEMHHDEHDGVLNDDDGYLSYTVSMKAMTFMTDDGEFHPEPITFELQYDKTSKEHILVIGEDGEYAITYGNVMAYMYFNAMQSA